MATFDVKITSDTIHHMTESNPTVMGVSFNAKPLTIPVEHVFTGFVSAVKALLSIGANDAPQIGYWIAKNDKDEVVEFVDIPNNNKTNELFNIFKKYGSFTTNIKFGYNKSRNTLYVSAKTVRDMSRYPNDTNAALVMYYLSLLDFLKATSNHIKNIQVDSYTNAVDVITTDNAAAALFKPFSAEREVRIGQLGTDDLIGIMYVKDTLSGNKPNGIYSSLRLMHAYNTATNEYAGAVVSVKTGLKTYTFVALEKCVYTDLELSTVEMSPDSIASAIAYGYTGTISVVHDKDLVEKFLKNCELRGWEPEELESLPNWLKCFTKVQHLYGATPSTSADVKYLVEQGVKISKGTMEYDCDEIKKQYAEDAYAQELYKQVKPYYDEFELGNLSANLLGFAKGAIYSMAFVGESGTGKSTAARVIPYKCGIPYISVNFSVNIEEADLFGSMFPNPEKVDPSDPEFVWQDGVITKAVRNGYVAILEEINFARPGVLGKLNSLLDENRQLDLPNGEVLRAHPNFRIIATCNIAYEGTNRFNKALINRFDDVTVFRDLKREDAIEVIKARTGYTDQAKLDKVYNVYEALKKFASEQNVNLVVSMRQLLNMFTKGKFYKDAHDAVTRIMLNGAFLEDAEYQKVFEDTVLPSFDLKFKI